MSVGGRSVNFAGERSSYELRRYLILSFDLMTRKMPPTRNIDRLARCPTALSSHDDRKRERKRTGENLVNLLLGPFF